MTAAVLSTVGIGLAQASSNATLLPTPWTWKIVTPQPGALNKGCRFYSAMDAQGDVLQIAVDRLAPHPLEWMTYAAFVDHQTGSDGAIASANCDSDGPLRCDGWLYDRPGLQGAKHYVPPGHTNFTDEAVSPVSILIYCTLSEPQPQEDQK